MLVGTQTSIRPTRLILKMLGGGMRQVGIVAAAGLISLEKMTKRLADDHTRAKRLADGLRQVEGLMVDQNSPYSNMVYLNLSEAVSVNAQQITQKMKDFGVLVDPENARRFRLVTHYLIDDSGVEKTISVFQKALN